ncbi:MAG: hypothetical protein OXU45_09620 [Candidatus Melainabacteria bacterium]|nr:hypothetical protein [Candidatus Melainabacteria bacterium]
MKSSIKTLIIATAISFSLTSCVNIRKIFGIESETVDFPPGDYIGTAKTILPEGDNGEAAAFKVKITFLPKEAELTDGIGVLALRDNSQRFFWRTDGNSVDSWNVLFHKDQNVYTSLSENFEFDGLISSSEVANKLEGRLHYNANSKIEDFYISAAQIFKPEIFEPKEPIEIKAGDEFEITVAKLGKDRDAIKVFYKSSEAKKSKELEIAKFSTDPKEGTKLKFVTDKKFAKGNYSLYLVRDGSQRSNKIGFAIK